MSSLNKVLLIGNLTRDPEVRYTPKETAVAEIGLAVNRVYSGDDGEKKEEVTFIDVTLWGRQAEVAQEYLHKGQPVFIEGRLQLDTWQDKQSGQKKVSSACSCRKYADARNPDWRQSQYGRRTAADRATETLAWRAFSDVSKHGRFGAVAVFCR